MTWICTFIYHKALYFHDFVLLICGTNPQSTDNFVQLLDHLTYSSVSIAVPELPKSDRENLSDNDFFSGQGIRKDIKS